MASSQVEQKKESVVITTFDIEEPVYVKPSWFDRNVQLVDKCLLGVQIASGIVLVMALAVLVYVVAVGPIVIHYGTQGQHVFRINPPFGSSGPTARARAPPAPINRTNGWIQCIGTDTWTSYPGSLAIECFHCDLKLTNHSNRRWPCRLIATPAGVTKPVVLPYPYVAPRATSNAAQARPNFFWTAIAAAYLLGFFLAQF